MTSPVGQGVPQVPPVWVPLSQITSVASTANVAASIYDFTIGYNSASAINGALPKVW